MDKIIAGVIGDFKGSSKEYIVCSRLYEIYTKRCNKANKKPMEYNWFGREVKKELNRKQIYINKKKVWVYAELSPAFHQHMLETSPAKIDIDGFYEIAKELFYYGKEDFDEFVVWYRGWVKAENLKEQWGKGNNS